MMKKITLLFLFTCYFLWVKWSCICLFKYFFFYFPSFLYVFWLLIWYINIIKEIKPVNPKGNQPWIFKGRTDVEAPVLWPLDVKSQLIGKDPDAGKDWSPEEKWVTKDEMVEWHHQLNRHEFEQTPGGSERQGSLAFCSPWGHRVNTT